MKGMLTSLLTLVIMVIGLVLIIGGPGAVRFLFAPLFAGLRQAARLLFVALVVLILVAAALSSRRSAPKHACDSSNAQTEQR